LAILATVVWSGNFVVARAVIHQISPVSLAFFRWSAASLVLAPFALPGLRKDMPVIRKHWLYLCWVALFGIAIFNTLLYVAGHYSPAINLALIGTTTSPVISIILAAFFLRESLHWPQILGVLLSLAGILLLLSRGDWNNLASFHFQKGDGWILLAALCFAIYNILVKIKPATLSPLSFLFLIFFLGSLFLFPIWLMEKSHSTPMQWSGSIWLIIGYLGIGASALAYLCWNAAIARLGAGRTALFGNLIPLFSSMEAVWLLNESFSWLQIISGLIVIGGILLANLKK
jgi:drug/metabolite transporter (DMT)-like permease